MPTPQRQPVPGVIGRLAAAPNRFQFVQAVRVLLVWLRRAGIRVRQQFHVPGVGYVDCLIGERLIIELDSMAHHADPTADRRRDALLSARGFRVLRFMYSQVMDRWPEVERAVLAAISRGDHLPA